MSSDSRDDLEQGIEPSPWRWAETAVLTIGPVAIALLFRPGDPLFVGSDFPWLALSPLLAGLRYGFAHGLASSLGLALATLAAYRTGFGPSEFFPGARVVGTLVVGMLAGEFSDRWLRRLQRLRVVGRYRQQRLEEFSRAYHLLKVSHDRLEERMAGSTTSLRGALLSLRRRLATGVAKDLSDVGGALMELFAEHGWVQVAGLHAPAPGGVGPEPVARLGEAPRVDPRSPMITRALETGALVTVREIPTADGPLAVVPLEDIEGRRRGAVVIHEMPFVAFTEEHLHLLVVLGGHTADLLGAAEQAEGVLDPAAQDFLRALRRVHEDLRRFALPVSLVGVAIGAEGLRLGVDQLVEGTKRGLDRDWRRPVPGGGVVLLLLMPLTDLQGVSGYERRIRLALKERVGPAVEAEVRIASAPLVPNRPVEVQLSEFEVRCGLR